MDNASKALIIAGGILTALLILGMLALMFNQVAVYQKATSDSKRDEMLASFNYDFERYADDRGINGTDLISLGNKIIDYNKKAESGGVSNSAVDYSLKIKLTVSNMYAFSAKYGYKQNNINDSLFKANVYYISAEEGANKNKNTLKEILDNYSVSDRELLTTLSAIYGNYNNENDAIDAIAEKLKEIDSTRYNNWNKGNNYNNISPTLDDIKHFKEYSEFKISTFKPTDVKYKNGQIIELHFKFVE